LIKLPRTSAEQAKAGTRLGKNTDEAKKGDLIFFKTNKRSQINHVGIVTEVNNEEIIFIHSSTSKGVIHSSTKQSYYKKTFAQLNRILE
jgi:cell wall-associated NlpC family hydrolase